MKKETTRKAIEERYGRVFKCGYCDIQNIFCLENPEFYNAGVYGWNFDVYTEKNIAICTGYRNMVGKLIPYELIEKYDAIAREIRNNRALRYALWVDALEENKNNFLNELLKL